MMNNRLFSIFSEIYESERFDASQSLQSERTCWQIFWVMDLIFDGCQLRDTNMTAVFFHMIFAGDDTRLLLPIT
jgi:hypothetical protein